MRAEHTRYEVPGWGVGDLWTGGGLVLAHELGFDRDAGAGPTGADGGARDAARSAFPAPLATRLPTPLRAEPSRAAPSAACAAPSAAPSAAPLEGALGPPARTLASAGAQVGNGSAPSSSRSPAAGALAPSALVERFRAFFAGEECELGDVPIDLDWATPFQHAVAATLRGVRRGEVVAYGELAALAGYPGAGRAVGTFCAHNRFMLLVPCHRVVGASGLGGYGTAGLDVKRRLLELEGVRL